MQLKQLIVNGELTDIHIRAEYTHAYASNKAKKKSKHNLLKRGVM